MQKNAIYTPDDEGMNLGIRWIKFFVQNNQIVLAPGETHSFQASNIHEVLLVLCIGRSTILVFSANKPTYLLHRAESFLRS